MCLAAPVKKLDEDEKAGSNLQTKTGRSGRAEEVSAQKGVCR